MGKQDPLGVSGRILEEVGSPPANFSASLIRDAERLGANLTTDARAGIMQIWRYASWLIGTPEALLLDATMIDNLRCRLPG